MHLEGKLDHAILVLPEEPYYFRVGVKAHRGAGLREVAVPRIQAHGETVAEILQKDMSPEEIILAAFKISEADPLTYIPEPGVSVTTHIPGEGILPVKSGTIVEVPMREN